jgi:hypothetical protein
VAEAAYAGFGAGRQPTPAAAHQGQVLLRQAALALTLVTPIVAGVGFVAEGPAKTVLCRPCLRGTA